MKKYGINYSLVVVDRVSSETHQHFCANTGLTRGELGTSMSHLWCLLQGIQKELDKLGPEFTEDGVVKTVLRERIVQEKQCAISYTSAGPGSMTCDRAGPVTLEDCKDCWGTGHCRYGKTEEEWVALEEKITKRYIAHEKECGRM